MILRPAWVARPRSIKHAPCSPNMSRNRSASASSCSGRCVNGRTRSIDCATATFPTYLGSHLSLKAGNDLGLDRLEFGVADEFGIEHFARLPQPPGRL